MTDSFPVELVPKDEPESSLSDSIEKDSVSASAKQMGERIGLSVSSTNVPYANIDNVHRVLLFYKYGLTFDEFHQKVFKANGKEWNDSDTRKFTIGLQRCFGFHRITTSVVEEGIKAFSDDNVSNEPRDWMNSLVWDGVPRLGTFFQDYVGAKNTDYVKAINKNFWISMVARIFRPGCQVDNMVVLEGRQGIYKSSLFEEIGGKWYSSVTGGLDNKDFYLSMQGKILFEFAELQKFDHHDLAIVKGMITNRVDRYRVPFGRRTQDFPRQLVFCGTTNDHIYLLDDENRRQWPIRTDDNFIDIKKLIKNREQLFAEAVNIYKSQAVEFDRDRTVSSWWIVPVSAIAEQDARRQIDPWEPIIQSYIRERDEVETHIILQDCLKVDVSKMTRWDNIRVGKILRLYQWDRVQKREGFVSRWVYKRPGPPLDDVIFDNWKD